MQRRAALRLKLAARKSKSSALTTELRLIYTNRRKIHGTLAMIMHAVER